MTSDGDLIVVALGGNALLRRDESPTAANQRRNGARAAERLGRLAGEHRLIVTHGNGPQIGLLALQSEAADPDQSWPLDVLGAETDGMIGHLLAQELRTQRPDDEVAVLLTQVRVSPDDPAFQRPTKPIGRVYPKEEAERLAEDRGWSVVADGNGWRRAVPSPAPVEILELRTIRLLVDAEVTVVCAGGGGIPVFVGPDRVVRGVEAVIDKDATSALLAERLGADLLLLLTDVDGIYRDFGTDHARRIDRIGAAELRALLPTLPEGSIRPKAAAAVRFVERTGHPAVIGSLDETVRVVEGETGTRVVPDHPPHPDGDSG